jgi:hypothetical protein
MFSAEVPQSRRSRQLDEKRAPRHFEPGDPWEIMGKQNRLTSNWILHGCAVTAGLCAKAGVFRLRKRLQYRNLSPISDICGKMLFVLCSSLY